MKTSRLTYFTIAAWWGLCSFSAKAAINDRIANAMDEVSLQVEKVGTIQEEYTSYATTYMQGKIGEFGDINAVAKATQRFEKAKKTVEKLKKLKEKAEKKVAELKEQKEKLEKNITDIKAKKEEITQKVKNARQQIDKQIAEANKLAQESRDKYQQTMEKYSQLVQQAEYAREQFEKKASEASDLMDDVDDSELDYIADNSDDSQDDPLASHVGRVAFDTQIVETPQAMSVVPAQVSYEMPVISNEGLSASAPLLTADSVLPDEPDSTAVISDIAATAAVEPVSLSSLPDLSTVAQPVALSADEVAAQSAVLAEAPVADDAEETETTNLTMEQQLLKIEASRAQTAAVADRNRKIHSGLKTKDEAKPSDVADRKHSGLKTKDEAKSSDLKIARPARRTFSVNRLTTQSNGGSYE